MAELTLEQKRALAMASARLRLSSQDQAPPAEADPSEYSPESPEFQEKYGPTAGMGTLDKVRAGFGKAFVDLGRGARQVMSRTPAAALASGQYGSPEVDREVALSRERDAPLMSTGAGVAGNVAGNIAAAVPAMAVPGAASVPGAAAIGAGLGAVQPAASGAERGINVAAGGALGGVGQKAGQAVASAAARKLAQRRTTQEALKRANAMRDQTLSEGRKVGYVVPPTTTNPTMLNRLMEGAAGKLSTAQAASVKNQNVTNRLARRAIGLPDDEPLNAQALNRVRSEAGKVYDDIARSGEIVPDEKYASELSGLLKEVDEIAESFPDLNVASAEQIQSLVGALSRPKFSARAAQEAVKQLRKSGADNLSPVAAVDPSRRSLGAAQREAAGALEDMILRHLRAGGKTALADSFDEARRTIAKTYSIQNALNEATGNINAANLSSQLRRGKPLSGELDLVARFASAFPKAARETTESMPGISPLDFYAAGGTSAASGNLLPMAYPLARMGTRAGMLTGPGQRLAMPNYTPGLGGDLGLQGARRIGQLGAPAAAGSGLVELGQ